VRGLRPGGRHRAKLEVGSLESLSGRFVIAVLDATHAVQEINEENNIVVSLAIP